MWNLWGRSSLWRIPSTACQRSTIPMKLQKSDFHWASQQVRKYWNRVCSFQCFDQCWQFLPLLAGVAARNDLTLDFKKEVQKHLPAMRELNLTEAADYMEAWITDTLPLQPLLEVSAHLGWYWVGLIWKAVARQDGGHSWWRKFCVITRHLFLRITKSKAQCL